MLVVKRYFDEVKLTAEQARDAAKKNVQGYVPPIVVIGRVEFSKIVEIVSVEEIADLGTIEPQSQMFIEMNCTERMDRQLSTTLHIDGQIHFDDKPSEWRYVPPDATLIAAAGGVLVVDRTERDPAFSISPYGLDRLGSWQPSSGLACWPITPCAVH